MTDFLNLPYLRTLEACDYDDHYKVAAEGCVEPTSCPVCSSGLYKHGAQRQSYLDTPMHGKRVLIEIQRKRYRCKSCGKTLFEPLAAMDGKRLATIRLIEHIERHCLRKTFSELSREVGIDDKTVRHIFDDYIERMRSTVKFQTPEIMGIDELKIIGQYRAMITNVDQLALYDMLPTRKKADLISYFRQMPDKDQVKVITMDLWSVYRQVMENQFPGRMIVADRFHVLRMANDAMEKTRKLVRRELDTRTRLKLKDDWFVLLAREHNLSDAQRLNLLAWEAQFPLLGAAYRAKEAFHEIYACETRSEAERTAKAWKDSIPSELTGTFREVANALVSWWDEIFNWYECRISNGYTESIKRLAKDMNRMGRGYSFDVIRARLLYDGVAREPTRKTIRTKKRVPKETMGFMAPGMGMSVEYETVEAEGGVEYGPHIPTLCELLESGHFQ